MSTALSLANLPDASADAETSQPIRVMLNTHSINFPHEILFHIKAEAEYEIIEITLFYLIGDQQVKVYGYPKFTKGKTISAEYIRRTDGSNYLPNGVDIEYYYTIRDSIGNTLLTPRRSLEYRDPTYVWKELTVGALTITWHNLPETRVRRVSANVEQRLQSVRDLLGINNISPIKGVIINSRGEADRSFPLVSATASRGHLYGGFAFDRYDLFVLAGLDPDGMVHEATHLLVDQVVNSPRAKIPAWLNEGLAMYFESGSSWRQQAVRQGERLGSLIPIHNMNTVPGKPADIRTFYNQSWSIVNFMISVYGSDRIRTLLNVINSGQQIDDAVLLSYGISLEQLEADWIIALSGGMSTPDEPYQDTILSSVLAAFAITSLASAYTLWGYRFDKSLSTIMSINPN